MRLVVGWFLGRVKEGLVSSFILGLYLSLALTRGKELLISTALYSG